MDAAQNKFDFLIDDGAVLKEIRRMRKHLAKSLERFTDPDGDLPLSTDLHAALAACDAIFAASESTLAACTDDEADGYDEPQSDAVDTRPVLRLIVGGLRT